jgi:GGDEF domain-containing protein
MSEGTPTGDREHLQKSIECYLAAVIGFTTCISEICPDVGVPFRNQWRRLPPRLGFDSSIESLEKSRRTLDASLENLREFAGAYLSQGLPTVRQIAESGGRAMEMIVERNAANAAQMASLADSLDATADLGAPPELRDQLEHYSGGLRAGARRIETEMIPALAELQRLVKACQSLMETTRNANVTDPATELFNERGFLRDVEHQLRRGSLCIVVVDLTAKDSHGRPCQTRVIEQLHHELAPRIIEPFRAFDSVARIGPARFAVIFAGTIGQAEGRQKGITRSISGQYTALSGRVDVTATLQVLEINSMESAQALVQNAVEDVEPALQE